MGNRKMNLTLLLGNLFICAKASPVGPFLPPIKPAADPFYGLSHQQTEAVHYLDRTIEDLINQVMADYKIEPVQRAPPMMTQSFARPSSISFSRRSSNGSTKSWRTRKRQNFPSFKLRNLLLI